MELDRSKALTILALAALLAVALGGALLREQAKKEPSIERVGQLLDLAQRLERVSPHQLRHGLAYRLRKSGKDAADIQRALRHSRASTSLKYGKPTDDDVRAALEESERSSR